LGWDNYIKYATFAYNTSVHQSTGYTPFYLLKGFEAREPNDVLPELRLLILSDPKNMKYETLENKTKLIKEKRRKSEERPLLGEKKLLRTLTLPLKLKDYDLKKKVNT
jgi:hypothetical protein